MEDKGEEDSSQEVAEGGEIGDCRVVGVLSSLPHEVHQHTGYMQ